MEKTQALNAFENRSKTSSEFKNSHNKNNKQSQNQKLYEFLLHIYHFNHLEDFLFLKSNTFLEICEVKDIHWHFNECWIKKDFSFSPKKEGQLVQWSCPLNFKTNNYGKVVFFSSQKFSQNKKNFLKKISFFTAVALNFIENKKKMEDIKQQWSGVFDSFSQAFCITDKNFKIIRFNQSFQEISNTKKTNLYFQNFFKIIPFSVKIPRVEETEGSQLIKVKNNGREVCWKISFKPLFLKREKIQVILFLIKNVTEEMEIEAKLSVHTKERELGLIKGSIAHELNNPISGIKTLLSLIEKQTVPKSFLIKDSLKEMKKAIDRCYKIIESLLFISKNSTEKLSSPSPNPEKHK